MNIVQLPNAEINVPPLINNVTPLPNTTLDANTTNPLASNGTITKTPTKPAISYLKSFSCVKKIVPPPGKILDSLKPLKIATKVVIWFPIN